MRTFTLLALALVLCATAVHAEGSETKETGFTSIFNGKDLTGWEGDPRLWSVKDGAIVGESTEESPVEQNTFLTWTGGEVGDFVLRLSYRLRNHNSGIQYRSHRLEGRPYGIGGYQADLADAGWIPGICYEEAGRGILAKQGQKVHIKADGEKETVEQFAEEADLQALVKANDWNDYEVVVKGNTAIHRINGHDFCIVVDDEEGKRADKGLLAFQMHVGPPMKVEFKDIRIKRAKTEAE